MDSPKIPYVMFLGRWCPFHKGHAAMIKAGLESNPGAKPLIVIKDTDYDEIPIVYRKFIIKAWLEQEGLEGKVIVVPNITSVCYGRDVGYSVNKIDLSESTEGISATQIRKKIQNKEEDWKDLLAVPESAPLIELVLIEKEEGIK